MIVFRHCVSNFGNIVLECSGHVPYGRRNGKTICAAATALMASLVAALRKIDRPTLRLTVEERIDSEYPNGFVSIRCKYAPETASMTQVTIAGFEWLAEKAPLAVRIERVTGKSFSESGKKSAKER